MLLFWCIYLVQRNISIVDIGWGVGFLAVGLVDFILGDGYEWRKILILILVSTWALRLSIHIAQRYRPEHDDPRYPLVMQKWPFAGHPLLQVLSLFAFQGLLITILSLPFALMCQNGMPCFSVFEIFGLLILMGGLLGETAADRQLDKFKRNPLNKGQVCEEGLWGYSRHPNYFFEWIIWIGFAIMTLAAPYGWLGVISPVLMLYLLLEVSGVPLAEAQALESKGEAYRDYQARTSVFFPWFSQKKVEVKKEPPSELPPSDLPGADA